MTCYDCSVAPFLVQVIRQARGCLTYGIVEFLPIFLQEPRIPEVWRGITCFCEMAGRPMNDTNLQKSVYWTVGMLAVHCVAGCGILALLVYIVPRFMAIFADFDAELPAMTLWMISLATLLVSYWYLILGPAFAVDAAVFIGLSRLRSGGRWAMAFWFMAVLGAMILFAGFVVVALFLPMQHLHESLS